MCLQREFFAYTPCSMQLYNPGAINAGVRKSIHTGSHCALRVGHNDNHNHAGPTPRPARCSLLQHIIALQCCQCASCEARRSMFPQLAGRLQVFNTW
jgi:hypothetical protein